MKISLFNCRSDNSPRLVERSWTELCGKMKRPPIRKEKDGALWSPAVFDPPQRRLKNVQEVSLLGLDYDCNASFERDLEPWHPYNFAAHTTFNHSEEQHRFRVILPLKDPIPASEFPALWKWAALRSGGKIDPAASDASRMFYVPVRRSESAPYLFEINEGEILDWTNLELESVVATVPRVRPSANGHSKDIGELIRKAVSSRNGAETFALLEGDTSAFGGDGSRADFSLASRLAFFSGPDPALLELMMRRSRLVRPKWEEKHYGDGRTYLQGLCEKALEGMTEFYTNGNSHVERSEERRQIKPGPSGFKLTTLDDLLAEPEEEKSYVWDKTLPCGGISIIGAKPKVGKSTLARGLTVAVSEGKPFLGRSTLRGKVIYLCLEEKRREVAAHFRRMGASGDNIIIHTGPTPADAFTALENAIEEHAPVLVVIDPLSRFVRIADFSSYGEATRQLEPLIDLARLSDYQPQPHILCCHHNGKGGDLRESGDALLGSTGFFGAVDTLLSMHKRERARTVESIQRYGEDLPEMIVHLDPETGIVEAAGDMKEFTLNERKQSVLDALSNDPVSEATIKDLVGGTNGGLTSKAVRALYDEGALLRTGGGKKGDPFLYQIASRILPDEIYFPPDCNVDETLEGLAIREADRKGWPDAVR